MLPVRGAAVLRPRLPPRCGVGIEQRGLVEFINAPSVNGGVLKSEGIDFVAAYRTSLNRFMTG